MKSFFTVLSAIASLAVAAPHHGGHHNKCISQSEAETLVARYAAVIAGQPSDLGGPVKTARAIAAKGYSEQSDSANQLGGLPLGSLTVATKRDWIYESQNNPPFPTETQAVYVTDCNKVTWLWISPNFGSGAYPVQGIHLLTTNDDCKLTMVNFEFNSFAAALDTGYTIFYANGTQYGA
ncbi:uncharacterized protein LTR77_011051 [Saxophila tyrrhenica]|uniref:NTF2-like domain-containing protein n=1 Tax=Saxophila tyrrhenica TaxID=1690608 RepID=A0AAV9NXT3_9PEZI|nr:hypothetical protein LTR77_011051 [Saxophila tyrrhenica]